MTPLTLARPRDITALFRDSLRVYFRHAGTFILLSAVVIVPVHLIVEGIGLDMLTGPYDDSPPITESVVPTVVGFLVVMPLVTAICIYALQSDRGGRGAGSETGARLRLRGVHATLLRRGDRGARHSGGLPAS